MHGTWLASYVVLWLIVLLLCVATFSLMRLIGQLHQRVGPTPALVFKVGPEIGASFADVLKEFNVGESRALTFPKESDSLLVFVAPGCPACESLPKVLERFRSHHGPGLEVVLISTSDRVRHNQKFVSSFGRESIPFIAFPSLAKAIGIQGTPFSLWLDPGSIVKAKGLTSSLEHFQSLHHARLLGVSSINEYNQKYDLNVVGG